MVVVPRATGDLGGTAAGPTTAPGCAGAGVRRAAKANTGANRTPAVSATLSDGLPFPCGVKTVGTGCGAGKSGCRFACSGALGASTLMVPELKPSSGAGSVVIHDDGSALPVPLHTPPPRKRNLPDAPAAPDPAQRPNFPGIWPVPADRPASSPMTTCGVLLYSGRPPTTTRQASVMPASFHTRPASLSVSVTRCGEIPRGA